MSPRSFVVNMRSAAVFAFACAAVCGTSLAAVPRLSYSMPSYVMEVSPGSSTSALDSQKLAFPGMTLDDVKARLDEGYVVGSCQCGGNSRKVPIQNQSVLVCRNSGGDITKIVVVFAFFDDNYTKSVGVELTNGSEGVYARARRSQYIRGDNQGFVFAELNAAGDDVVYSADSGNSGHASGSSVVGYGGQGYGASGLALVQMPGPTPSLVWANADGESVLTLEDIRGYELSARFCGGKLGMENLNAVSPEYNRYVEEDSSGAATSITVEFQVLEGSTVKCVVVKYTNGAEGIYAQTLGWGEAVNGTIGQRFMAADGTYSDNAETSGRYGIGANSDNGYGVYALAAKPRGFYVNMGHLGSTLTAFDEAKMPAIGTSWTKLFANVSIQDLVDGGYKISGWLCGPYISTKQKVVATFKTYTPSGSASATKGLCVFAGYDGGHTKAAIVELETRVDGVFVKFLGGRYLDSTNNLQFDFASFDEDGNVVYADGSKTYNYSVGGLSADAKKFMRADESCRVWANPYGAAVLTLDDIKDHYFGCYFDGGSMSSNIKGKEGIGLNRVFTYDGNGSVTSMLVEFQIEDGPYDKCVVMDFTNGVDGVYGKVRRSCFVERGTVGFRFTNEDGSPAGNGAGVATSETAAGYGIYGPFAAPMITLGEDTEWNMFEMFDDTAVVNMNGYSLTVDGLPVSDTTYARLINTNVDATAELHLNLQEGRSFNNSSVRFGSKLNNTHNIKFFKEGLGTYTATTAQDYTGGTEVVAGTLRAGNADNNVFGAKTGAVKVDEGAAIDWYGKGDFNGYPAFVLDGGTVQNTGNAIGSGTAVLRGFTLLTNSYLTATSTWGLINGGYAELPLILDGNTLDIEIGGDRTLYFINVKVPDSGSINVHGNGVLEVATAGNGFRAPNVDLCVASELRCFGAVSVHDYVAADTKDAVNLGTGELRVGGTFTPQTAYFRGCTMLDGSTVDLSGWTGAWPVKSSYTCSGNRDILFEGGATVTIEVGSHEMAIGDCLIEMAPGNTPGPTVQFVLCTNGVAVTDKELTSKDNEEGHGLYIKDARLPSYAKWDVSANHWRFYLEDGTEYPDPWPDGVTGDMQVRFSTMLEYEALLTNNVSPSAYVLTRFDSEPGAVNDLTRDLPFILDAGLVFDVKGGRIKLPAAIMGGEKEFTVTSSLEDGVIEIYVSKGVEITNTKMALAGSLKVEKVGEGSFVAAKTGQTYTGGTHVMEGTLKAGTLGIYGAFGDTSSAVLVEKDAVLDWNGCSEFDGYPAIVLNGGTVQNTGNAIGRDSALLSGFVLQTNSYFKVPVRWCLVNRYHAEIAFNLGGNTLDVEIGSGSKIYFSNVNMSGDGVVNIHGDGVFEVVNSGNGFSASNANLRAASALNILKQASVHDYEAADTKNAAELGTGVLSVYGTFKPVTQYFRGCTLQDGSTLDLSEWTGDWPVASAYTCSGNKTIEFAEGATVAVRIGGSNPPNGTKVVGWSQKPEGVTFVRAAGEGCALIVKDDGIYVRRGFAFLLK